MSEQQADLRLIGPEELAAFLDVPLATVYGWRTKGYGPRGVKIGRHIRYRVSDVDDWIDAQFHPG